MSFFNNNKTEQKENNSNRKTNTRRTKKKEEEQQPISSTDNHLVSSVQVEKTSLILFDEVCSSQKIRSIDLFIFVD